MLLGWICLSVYLSIRLSICLSFYLPFDREMRLQAVQFLTCLFLSQKFQKNTTKSKNLIRKYLVHAISNEMKHNDKYLWIYSRGILLTTCYYLLKLIQCVCVCILNWFDLFSVFLSTLHLHYLYIHNISLFFLVLRAII